MSSHDGTVPADPVRLHVVTDDRVLDRPDFEQAARRILSAGPRVALQLRGHGTTGAKLYALAAGLAHTSGGMLFVSDRIDIALASRAHGVHVGARSIDVRRARALCGDAVRIGYSSHAAAEALQARRDGADYVFSGTIWPSESHRGVAAAGIDRLAETSTAAGCAVYAIGGVTPARAAEAVAAGATGVAVLRGVWDAVDPASAVAEYLEAMGS